MSSERRAIALGGARICAVAVLAIAMAATSTAAPPFGAGGRSHAGVLRLDPVRTTIAFRLPGTLHDTHGTFRLTEGTLAVDAQGAASGTVIVDAASGDSRDTARDDRMRRVVLETERYPEIRFQPSRVDGELRADGGFHATMRGTLTLHGAVHDVAIDADGRVSGDEVVATSRFTIPYVAWGLADPSVLFLTVANEVQLEVDTAGRVTWGGEA